MEPIQEYQRDAKESFLDFLATFDELTISYLMLGIINKNEKTGELNIQFP